MAQSNSTTIEPWDPLWGQAATQSATSYPWVTLGNTSANKVTMQGSNVMIGQNGVFESVIQEKDLDKDVYNIPIERLINLWITRFSNDWVNLDNIDEDDFFKHAYKRLKQLGELETHYLTDRARYVCRIPQ